MKVAVTPGELTGEALATGVLFLFGIGSMAQVATGGGVAGDYNGIAWGWGWGVVVGVYLGHRVAGGHLNPAVTVALACLRLFPWRKVGWYCGAQFVGGFGGSLLVWLLYRDQLAVWDPRATMGAAIFATAPAPGVSLISATAAEVVGTAVLVLGVLALIEARNAMPGANLEPFVIGGLVVGIALALGGPSGWAINPVHGLSPRLVAAIAGYGSGAWLDAAGQPYWLVPIFAPFLGGAVGAWLWRMGIEQWLPGELADTPREPLRVPDPRRVVAQLAVRAGDRRVIVPAQRSAPNGAAPNGAAPHHGHPSFPPGTFPPGWQRPPRERPLTDDPTASVPERRQ